MTQEVRIPPTYHNSMGSHVGADLELDWEESEENDERKDLAEITAAPMRRAAS